MKVVLQPGQKLEIAFADDKGRDIDGNLFVEFKFNELAITTEWPDSDGRVGKIYSERFTADENYKAGVDDPLYYRPPGC